MTSRRELLKHSLAASAAWAGAPLAALSAQATIVPGASGTTGTSGTTGRTALVIGNDRYRHNPLNNATNDARSMAELLGRAGFAVDLRLNATQAQMKGAIQAFGQAMSDRSVGTGLFFYAGHAAQLDWRNYMLPVDGNVEAPGDIRNQCVDLKLLIDTLGRTKGKTGLIFLDACRDDPFGPRVRAPLKGIGPYDAPAGTLLAFGTAPGRVAVEVVGSRNGLYTEHLVRELAVKGVSLEAALKRVRTNVVDASGGAQVPWESTSLDSDVYLFPAPKLSAAELERQAVEELETWNRIKASLNPADWAGYLKRYPTGRFAEAAQVRHQELLAQVQERRAAATRAPAPAPASIPRPAPQRAPALLLGATRPVPARFKGSGNPNSAGSYPFRPIWTPGDEFVFHDRHLHSNTLQQTIRLVVKRVDIAANRVEYANGTVIDLMGNLIQDRQHRYPVPNQVNPAELQVGRKWSSRFQQIGTTSGSGEYDFRIVRRENVKVPAGEFSAFKIVGDGSFMGPFLSNRGVQMTRWMVPGVNVAVRQEFLHNALARVLVSARQAVSA